MNQSDASPIVFSEWLSTGVMVHFADGVSVFFPAGFLFRHREVQPNQIFVTEAVTLRHAASTQPGAATPDAPYGR